MRVSFITRAIKDRWSFLGNPEKGYKKLTKGTFERALGEYLSLLLIAGLLSGIVTIAYAAIRALYYDVLYRVEIDYWNMLNYAVGNANGILFFYFFAGTFLLFILSMILRSFISRLKYVKLLELMFLSMSPYLLFGWIPILQPTLFVWSLVLLLIGIHVLDKEKTIPLDSVERRE